VSGDVSVTREDFDSAVLTGHEPVTSWAIVSVNLSLRHSPDRRRYLIIVIIFVFVFLDDVTGLTVDNQSTVTRSELERCISVTSQQSINVNGLSSTNGHRRPSERYLCSDLMLAFAVIIKIVCGIRTVTATFADVNSVFFATVRHN
jgi:hypothetical protein